MPRILIETVGQGREVEEKEEREGRKGEGMG
jgi:hypothetical protein